ncbi:hypothetical protein N0V88_000686 [Collariella sp. IMI 366227]|nr:hypothetical protein N0V88_000686 [Collariella sp. IMI 366227]
MNPGEDIDIRRGKPRDGNAWHCNGDEYHNVYDGDYDNAYNDAYDDDYDDYDDDDYNDIDYENETSDDDTIRAIDQGTLSHGPAAMVYHYVAL